MLLYGHANCGASVHPPHDGRFFVQLVRAHGHLSARQLQVEFGAPKCQIVDRALTRNEDAGPLSRIKYFPTVPDEFAIP